MESEENDLKGGEIGVSAEESKRERRRRAKQRKRAKQKGDEPEDLDITIIKLLSSMIEPLEEELKILSTDGIPELRKWMKMLKCFKGKTYNLTEEMKTFSAFFSDVNATLSFAFADAQEVKDISKEKNKGRNKKIWAYKGDARAISSVQQSRVCWNCLMETAADTRHKWDETLKVWDAGIEGFELLLNKLEDAMKEWNKVVDMDAFLKGCTSKWKELNSWRDKCFYQYKFFSRSFEFSIIDLRNAILRFLNTVLIVDFQEIPRAVENSFKKRTIADLHCAYQISVNKGKSLSDEVESLTKYFTMSTRLMNSFGDSIGSMVRTGNELTTLIAEASS